MKITVNGQNIGITDSTLTVEGSQNIYGVEFTFDSSWDEYDKTAVFQLDNNEPIQMVVTDNVAYIPNEALADIGYLRVGVFGTSGNRVMPTVWGTKLFIKRGTPTDITADPTPSVYAQLLEKINEITDMQVTAETLETGEEAYATYEDGLLTLGLPKGNKGDKGDRGVQGVKGDTGNGIASVVKTATVGLVDTYTITFTDGNTTTFDVTNGEGGAPITAQQIDSLFEEE